MEKQKQKYKRTNEMKILAIIFLVFVILFGSLSIAKIFPTEQYGSIEDSQNAQKEKYAKAVSTESAVINKATAQEETSNLMMEVTPVKGGAVLEDNGTVYEGEYIKYNIKVTNTTDEDMEDIRIAASIPDGVKYGELECNFEEVRQPYQYIFNEEINEKEFEIEKLEAGKSKELFYEVKVKDLNEEESEKDIITNIKAYTNEELIQSYEETNIVKPADTQMFLGSYAEMSGIRYFLNISSEVVDKEEVKIHFPKNVKLEAITKIGGDIENMDYVGISSRAGEEVYSNDVAPGIVNTFEIDDYSEENVLTAKFETNYTWSFLVEVDADSIERDKYDTSKEIKAYAEIADKGYMTNENRHSIFLQAIKISMESENENEKVKRNEEINYDITIENIGRNQVADLGNFDDYVHLKLVDFLPEGVNPIEIEYNNWELVIGEDNKVEGLEKIEKVNKKIYGGLKNSEGNQIAEIDIDLIIPREEKINLRIKTTAGSVLQDTDIKNTARISGDAMPEYLSNEVNHTILSNNSEGDKEPDKPVKEPDIPTIPDIPNVPKEPVVPSVPNEPTKEPNTPSTPNTQGTNTTNSGSQSSQATKKVCDFKIDKYISKVTVKTASGVKEYSYNSQQLAKVEIRPSEVEGALVTIEYDIVVTNVGEVEGTVSKVIDKLPKELNFSSELNRNWAKNSNGELVNTDNSNAKLSPGGKFTVKLIATKKMTQKNTGSFKNIAEIQTVSGDAGMSDANSGNNVSNAEIIIGVNTGAYIGRALIVLAIIISGVIIIYLCKKGKINISKLKKLNIFVIAIVMILACQSSHAVNQSEPYPYVGVTASGCTFAGGTLDANGIYHNTKWSNGIYYLSCDDDSSILQAYVNGTDASGGLRSYNFYCSNEVPSGAVQTLSEVGAPKGEVTATNASEQIEVHQVDGGARYKIGPLKYKASEIIDNGFTVEVYNKNNSQISFDMSGSLSNGTNEFYVTISEEDYKTGIGCIKLKGVEEYKVDVKRGRNHSLTWIGRSEM